jgi:large subunit ribosomal protein L15
MFLLSQLPKTTKDKRRRGRGDKNAGKGHKGQVKRGGKMRIGFEGGQKSLVKLIPKYKGYNFSGKVVLSKEKKVLSLTVLDNHFKENELVDKASLLERKLIFKQTKIIRVVNSGNLNKKLNFSEDIYLTKGVKKLLNI